MLSAPKTHNNNNNNIIIIVINIINNIINVTNIAHNNIISSKILYILHNVLNARCINECPLNFGVIKSIIVPLRLTSASFASFMFKWTDCNSTSGLHFLPGIYD